MFRRRGSSQGGDSTTNGGDTNSVVRANLGYGEISVASSSSDFPDDASDKESLKSYVKEQQEKEDEDDDDLFAVQQEKYLNRWFVAITIGLVLGGVGTCVFTYYYLSGQQQNNFKASFESTADSIAEGVDLRIEVIARALLSRSQSLTTFAVFTGSLWPFVSIPDFAVQGKNFILETDTELFAWAPLVIGNKNVRAWEPYSTYMLQNSGWFDATATATATATTTAAATTDTDTEPSDDQLNTQIVNRLEEQAQHQQKQQTVDEDVLEGGIYIPLWQVFPATYSQWITQNLTKLFEEPIELLLQTGQPVWSRFLDVNEFPPTSDGMSNQLSSVLLVNTSANASATVTATTTTTSISSLLFQPIFRSLETHDISYGAINFTTAQEEVVGIYIASIQWNSFLTAQIPEGTPDMGIVLQNSWGETITYHTSYNSKNSTTNHTFLLGDQHPPEYDEMLQSTTATTAQIDARTIQDKGTLTSRSSGSTVRHPHTVKELGAAGFSVTDALVNDDSGGFQMTIYPSKNFEEKYTSVEPLVLTVILAGIFFLAISAFCCYFKAMHNRQQKLVETANRTALVVKSLFPANVRNRIMKEAEESDQKSKAKQRQIKENDSVMDGSAGDRPAGGGLLGGTSILGNISVPSAGSRYSRRGSRRASTKASLDRSRNNSMGTDENPYGSKPIADHFSDTTVLFSDLVGFTAWSSVREPVAVFTLLETIYHAFDKVARKRGIFKVETIGDCYVAVCGLPVPRPDHAIAMSYFATDCIRKMSNLTKKLEVSLGPDTASLSMRTGLHSGPVTAGVLRGEKSRFQLFGDTVNTAARMESNGKRDAIHCSEATAQLLIASGKSKWLTEREDKIIAKGKGEMLTYWLEVRSLIPSGGMQNRSRMDSGVTDDDASSFDGSTVDFSAAWEDTDAPILGERLQRLVNWNVDQLLNLLKKIVANREEQEDDNGEEGVEDVEGVEGEIGIPEASNAADFDLRTSTSIAQEVTEVISFPKPSIADLVVGNVSSHCSNAFLGSKVVDQLHEYMTKIATLHNDNPFHSFAHASHVAMALTTWLSHITPPSAETEEANFYDQNLSGDWTKSSLSKSMFALQSDPLTHFALLFAALIHDVDHTGVPNSQLVKEKSQVAILYKGSSIHEQESVDSAFETLMDEKYSLLRGTIYTNEAEFYRFRQLVINCVMATDILDEKIVGRHTVRWGCLFGGSDSGSGDSDEISLDHEPENEGDQKASVVVERLLVISDIAHTMQHWYVYRKWNEKLFEEQYLAWKAGRAETDPSIAWYDNEIEFFDEFVIPFASKMKDCELFDSSCGESLRYAKDNREQWVNTGREEVETMLEKLRDIEYEVEDTFDPVSDGKVYSPSNGRRSVKPKDWQEMMDVSQKSFDTVFASTEKRDS